MKLTPKMKKDLKIFGSIAAFFSFGHLVVNPILEKDLRAYVKQNYHRISTTIQDDLGLNIQENPTIVHDSPPLDSFLLSLVALGAYRENTIYLPLPGLRTPDRNLRAAVFQEIGVMVRVRGGKTVDEILAHELGHFYIEKMRDKLNVNWPANACVDQSLRRATTLLDEGLAEYFQHIVEPQEDEFEDDDWPEQWDKNTKVRVLYKGGFHLVKPILDKYKREGIEYLLQNPPDEYDLYSLPLYQERALNDLHAQSFL